MVIRYLDDIERDKKNRERRERNEDLAEDIDDVINKVFKPHQKKKNQSFLVAFFMVLLKIGIAVLILDLILGSFWLLKFLINDLFIKYI